MHELPDPLQVSVVHGLLSSVQVVPLPFLPSAGQVIAPPQVSSASHSPAAGRQTVEAATGEQVPGIMAFAHVSQTPALHATLQQ
jgi:hypothetical protein